MCWWLATWGSAESVNGSIMCSIYFVCLSWVSAIKCTWNIHRFMPWDILHEKETTWSFCCIVQGLMIGCDGSIRSTDRHWYNWEELKVILEFVYNLCCLLLLFYFVIFFFFFIFFSVRLLCRRLLLLILFNIFNCILKNQ